VDCIAGISGGSFTAAYYGLFGAQTFERFYDRFLVRDIQRELALSTLNPVNLARVASPYFSRIDLAGELYDTTVFEGATYAALAKRRRPFVILHATSMANGAPVEFTKDEFDFLGSDLGSFPVGRATARRPRSRSSSARSRAPARRRLRDPARRRARAGEPGGESVALRLGAPASRSDGRQG
jgi:NTE family protein